VEFDAASCLERCLADAMCQVVQVPAGSLDGKADPHVGGCVFCCAELDGCGFRPSNSTNSSSNVSPSSANATGPTDVYVIGDDRDCDEIEEMGCVFVVVAVVIAVAPFTSVKFSTTTMTILLLVLLLLLFLSPRWIKWASAGVFAALGAAAFALGCQTAAFHAYNTLEGGDLKSWTWVCVAAVGSGAVLCLITGFAGYFSFFNFVEGEILDSFPDSDVAAQVGRRCRVVAGLACLSHSHTLRARCVDCRCSGYF